jgi:hypothetical protein
VERKEKEKKIICWEMEKWKREWCKTRETQLKKRRKRRKKELRNRTREDGSRLIHMEQMYPFLLMMMTLNVSHMTPHTTIHLSLVFRFGFDPISQPILRFCFK